MFIQIRKWSWWVAVLALFLVAAAPGKSVVWERIDVTLTINPDGTVDVEEQWRITFEGGPFRYGYRRIETRYLTDITDIQVLDEEGPYQPGTAETPRAFVIGKTSQTFPRSGRARPRGHGDRACSRSHSRGPGLFRARKGGTGGRQYSALPRGKANPSRYGF